MTVDNSSGYGAPPAATYGSYGSFGGAATIPSAGVPGAGNPGFGGVTNPYDLRAERLNYEASMRRNLANLYTRFQSSNADSTERQEILNNIQEETKFVEQVIGVDLSIRSIPYKVSSAFGRALGLVVL